MNQIIQIIVSYNSNEILIDLEQDDFDVFDTFIKILGEKTGEKNILKDFELMPVNTKMAYILIDENNFQNIIFENNTEEKLKIFMNKKESNDEEENDTILNNNKNKNKIKNNDDNDDDFSDNEEDIIKKDSNKDINEIIIEQKEEKKEQEEKDEITNININQNILKESDDILEEDNNNTLNINKLEENIKKEEKEKDEIIIEPKLKKINIVELFKDDLINNNNKKEKTIPIEKKEEEKNIFENEFCMKCNSPLLSKKYICIICPNLIFCDKCEKKHEHPCIIFKSKFISSLKDAYNFMNKQYDVSLTSQSKKSKKNISINFFGDKNVYLRPNKGVLLPVQIINQSDATIFSNDIMFLVKGNKFLDISYDIYSKYKIPPNQTYVLKFKCLTKDIFCKENITIEIFSNRYILKDNKNTKIFLNIEINEDKSEEELNLNLNYNEMIILYNKEHKKILKSLLENELKGYEAEEIIELLVKYNWNKEKFLKSMKFNKK